MKKIKLAILASGSGSNAEAILNWAKNSQQAEVVCVISDKKKARVLERATFNNIPALNVTKKKEESREDFDKKIIKLLIDYNPDLIILAGYMKILTEHFVKRFEKRIINIHPSLLPDFPGMDGYGEAFRAQVKTSGCTVHYVDSGVDTGEIIAQQSFDLIPGESFEDFKARGLNLENHFYPIVIEKLIRDFYGPCLSL